MEIINNASSTGERLPATEKIYDGLIQNSGDGITLVDENGRIIEWNPSQEIITGLPKEDVIGHYLWEVQVQLGYGYQVDEVVQQVKNIVLRLIRDGKGPEIGGDEIHTIKKPDGCEVIIQNRVFAIPRGDKFYLCSITRDVTQREKINTELNRRVEERTAELQTMNQALQESEQKLRLMTESLEEHVADRTRQLACLYEITSIASKAQKVEDILQQSLESALLAIHCDWVTIHLLDESSKLLELLAEMKLPGSKDEAAFYPLINDLARRVFQQSAPLCQDSDNPIDIGGIGPIPGGYLGVPMRAGENLIGVISAIRTRFGGFQETEMRLLSSIGDAIAVAIENALLRQKAEHAAVLAERERLSREIHDSVTQSVYSLTLFAEAGCQALTDQKLDTVASYLQEIASIAEQALKDLRLLVFELRPSALQDLGLAGALRQRLDTVERHAGVSTSLIVEELIDFPYHVQEELYRIAQEALNNALKHSGASQVVVSMRCPQDQFELVIKDNGKGFDPENPDTGQGMGISNMRERARKLGTSLVIESTPAKGTCIKVFLKIPQ